MNYRNALMVAPCIMAGLSFAAVPQIASAEDNPSAAQDLIVGIAQRRAELSRDVPISITTITGDQLTSSGANQLSDIANVTRQ